eukprot:TRINITY_DN46050_c0_g1_i1.p1 TRINITY_DN46050_c0_g1~~TRINITY_DN46050_c0_g1_i1.p1  ORF type:complete len:101 (+),score=31.69 TRINITY_DN46050_c0_g1_i1:97-399(+)
MFVFFFKQKTAYEMLRSLVGSEMCIRDSSHARSITFNHRKIVFLYKYSTVEMYEFFFFKGIDLRLHDRDTVTATPHDQSLLLGSATSRPPQGEGTGIWYC